MNAREYFDVLSEWMLDNMSENEYTIIFGDFNVDFLNKNNYELNYVNNFINNIGLKQLVIEPTRITSSSKTLIDYVLSDHTTKIEVKVRNEWKVSDHETLNIKLFTKSARNYKSKQIRCIKYRKDSFVCALNSGPINSMSALDDINIYSNKFEESIRKALAAVTITVQIDEKCAEWYNSDLFNLKRNKIVLYNRAKYLNLAQDWKN